MQVQVPILLVKKNFYAVVAKVLPLWSASTVEPLYSGHFGPRNFVLIIKI